MPAVEPRSSIGEGTSAEAPIRSTSRPPPQIPASNFVVIKRTNDGITGSYVIDTQLRVPKSVALWSPEGSETTNDDGLISGETPHLYLESTHGSVHADIWLVRGRGSAESGQEAKAIGDDRALINVKTGHSVINTRLVSNFKKGYFHCLLIIILYYYKLALRYTTAIHTLLLVESRIHQCLATIDLCRPSNNINDSWECLLFPCDKKAMYNLLRSRQCALLLRRRL